jgi:hypothetical protein
MDDMYSRRLKLFTDRSSFVQGGWQKAGFMVTTANDIHKD